MCRGSFFLLLLRGNFKSVIQQRVIALAELNNFFKQMPEMQVSFFNESYFGTYLYAPSASEV